MAPESSLVPNYFRSFLLRDARTYISKVRPTRSLNAAHPDTKRPGIIRTKAYDSIKELFAVMFSDYRIFGSPFLPLLAVSDEMIQDL